ncbi:MAG: EamA family transporter RarD [Chloroflexi bacterium]|nr:MAG: EamA family transporter RarD [Chloroflexota bacterium]
MNKGVLYAGGAYLLWGLFPIYWKALQNVPATEILGHRMVWSLGFVVLLLAFRRHWGWVKTAVSTPRTLITFIASGILLGINWLTYIWGVNAGFVVETSLGYFINPLVSVVFGVLFLRERLRVGQWTAVFIAFIGVVYLTMTYGQLPWIALTLAFSFACYGLLRKTATLNSVEGLSMETAVLFPFALAYLLYLGFTGQAVFAHASWMTTLLLVLTGGVTAVPLLLFAAGARRINLSTLGILQYIAPTIQFLLGIFLYNEPFTIQRFIGFSLIWLALLVYSVEGVRNGRKLRLQSAV